MKKQNPVFSLNNDPKQMLQPKLENKLLMNNITRPKHIVTVSHLTKRSSQFSIYKLFFN